MAINNGNIHSDINPDDFTLESILAEFKSAAYIDGDKKTPPEILDKKAERIIMEEVGDIEFSALLTSETAEEIAPADDPHPGDAVYISTPEIAEAYLEPGLFQDAEPEPMLEPESRLKPGQEPKVQVESDPNVDADILFFENFRYSESVPQDEIVQEVERAIERELDYGEDTREAIRKGFGLLNPPEHDALPHDNLQYNAPEEIEAAEEETFAEPELKQASKRFAAACNSISLRCLSALVVSLIMAFLTLMFEANPEIIFPFGIGQNQTVVIGLLMILLLVVMILLSDLIVHGVKSLIKGEPGAETLILFACVFSLISGAVTIIRGEAGINLLPYCVVPAFSLSFAAFGEKCRLQAITDSLRTASASAEPYGVFAEYSENIDKSILKKAYGRVDGFYNNLMHPDVGEMMYRYAAPILFAATVCFSVITTLIQRQGEYFLHTLSAMLAAAAPFSAILAFAVPFGSIAKAIRKSGAAIAGWGGADDICYTDGACVTDDDLFPPGTITSSGEKTFEDVNFEKALRCTASLIIASGSGLTRVFGDMLEKRGYSMIQVEEFAAYEGGVGALIEGERVMTGSAAFMNLLGVRIPDDVNLKNVVFTAVNDRLIGMFAINYVPTNSVQNALISVMKWRVKLFLAVRDFNITPLMLEQKFKVSLEGIAYIPVQNSYTISDLGDEKEGRMSAILTREGFGPFAEVVTRGRMLKATAGVSVIASIVSAALGVLMMFYMFWMGAIVSARPGNLLLFMLAMLGVVLVICGRVKFRK
ncbi:MAG: hypothetical protein FWC96_08890 [Oscillospiraceae bacterium]|nr:hypothetical protein [Oscillospiraceae bacterium]